MSTTSTERSPADQCYDRLTAALGEHDVHPEDRQQILDAYGATGDQATWDELPADIRDLVTAIEAEPRTSWDDPADVPDQL